MHRFANLFVLAVLFCAVGSVYSATIHVPSQQPTIQAGINAAVNGDTVLVAPGVYVENVSYGGKNLVLLGHKGADSTFLQPAITSSALVNFSAGVSSNATLEGFTLRNTVNSPAVYVENSSPRIQRNKFTNHASNSQNHAILRVTGASHPTIKFNLFFRNRLSWGTIWSDADSIIFTNNTVVSGVRGLVVYSRNSFIENNIVSGCSDYGIWVNNLPMTRRYNDIWGNTDDYLGSMQPGPGDISYNPLFVDTANGDYHIQSSSPCLDKGNPSLQQRDPDGTRNDIGAFSIDQHPQIQGVPSEFTSIQSAIDAANDLDTVLVTSGTYTGVGNQDISTRGKRILVTSDRGPDSTIIFVDHGPFDYRGFVIDAGEDTSTIIDGFTVTSSPSDIFAPAGGAVHCFNSSPRFRNCKFSHQWGPGGPGAVLLENSNAEFIGCVFEQNQAGNSAYKVSGGSVQPNIGGSGGGVGAVSSLATFRACTFRNNIADEGNGGAVSGELSNLTFDSCLFESNAASNQERGGLGGAFYGTGTFIRCTFVGNQAYFVDGGGAGGALYGTVTVEGCLFIRNGTYDEHATGGAIFGSGAISRSTFVGNICDEGSSVYASGSMQIQSSIFYGGNDIQYEEEPADSDACIIGPVYITCCNIYDNSTGDWIGDLAALRAVSGNGSSDPLFCDINSGDYSISNVSYCAPENNPCLTLIGARPVDCYDNPIVVPGTFPTIQDAVDAARSGDTILLLPGTYSGYGNTSVRLHDRSLTITSQSGPDSTIVDCATDSLGEHWGFWLDYSDTAVFTFNGLTIKNAFHDAIYAQTKGVILRNMRFDNNRFNFYPIEFSMDSCELRNSSLFVGDNLHASIGSCTVVDCGIWISGPASGPNQQVDVRDCQFLRASVGTGLRRFKYSRCYFGESSSLGVFDDDQCPGQGINTIDSCTFESSWLANSVNCSNWDTLIVRHSTFVGPSNQNAYVSGVTIFENCLFTGNTNPNGTTLVLAGNQEGLGVCIRRSIITANQSRLLDCSTPAMVPELSCTDIFGNTQGDWTGCISGQLGTSGNFSADPVFCDTANGDYHIAAESPCAPANNSCGQLIGALGVACAFTPAIVVVGFESETLSHVLNPIPKIFWSITNPQPQPLDSFLIAVGTDNDWQFAEKWNPAPFATSDTFVTYDGSALVDGQTYYLRLRVHNTLAWSDWYQTSFRMNSVPSTPVLRAPTNLAVVGSTPILWVANATDAQNDPLTYEFAGFHDTDCVAGPAIDLIGVLSGTDSTGGQITDPLAENCRYWWRARAFDGYEYSPWTSYAQFMVNGAPEAPSAPMLDYPPLPDNKPIFTLLPTLGWQNSYDPDPGDTVRYRLELSDRANFSFALVRDSLLNTNLPLTDSLVFGTHYYWRVTARDKSGLSAISGVKEFWTWKPGDLNHSHGIDLSDLSLLIGYLTQTPRPDISPKMVGDLTGNCKIDLSDLSLMVAYMTTSGVVIQVGCE